MRKYEKKTTITTHEEDDICDHHHDRIRLQFRKGKLSASRKKKAMNGLFKMELVVPDSHHREDHVPEVSPPTPHLPHLALPGDPEMSEDSKCKKVKWKHKSDKFNHGLM